MWYGFNKFSLKYKIEYKDYKLYSSLPESAPEGEVLIVEGTAQPYRLQKINGIRKEIAAERDKHANLYKKYHRVVKVISGVYSALSVSSMGLGAAGIGVLSTIIAALVAIAMEGVALGTGLLSIVAGQTNKQLLMKAGKHEKIKKLTEQS